MFPRKSNTRYYDDPEYVSGMHNTLARTPTGNYIYPMKNYIGYDPQTHLYPYGLNPGTPYALGYSSPEQNLYRGLFSQQGTKSGSGSITGPSIHALYQRFNMKQMAANFPQDVTNQK